MTRFLILVLLVSCAADQPPTPPTPTSDPRQVVSQFGQRLQNVSLLGPQAADEMRREYATFVTPELLQSWVANPKEAPGRLTSSPWPDRIDITAIDDRGDSATVSGAIIEATNDDGDVRRVPVEIELVRQDRTWKISGWSVPDEPLAVLEAYYGFINGADYDRAYALWSEGASGQTFEQFREGYADTERVHVEIGEPDRIGAAAGSRYITIPVTITATTRSQSGRQFRGTYTLRRSVVDGATPEQRQWRIASAEIEPVSGKLLPVDAAESDPSLQAFRQKVLEIVRRQDRAALLPLLDPNIRVSFGMDGGREDFVAHWNLDEGDRRLWSELEWVLTHGGIFRGEGENRTFWAPYVYSAWPGTYDAFEHVAVTDDALVLRAQPRDAAAAVTTLSYDIVRVRGQEQNGWRNVETLSGQNGWAPVGSLRSPIDYRAALDQRNGEWRMSALIAGD